jgi:iron complex transport system permease protein
VAKSVLPPMELPAGIITAIIGAPYFLYLLRRRDVLSI